MEEVFGMIFDFDLVLQLLFFTAFGAIVRASLGIYKAYSSLPSLTIDWKRIVVEILASMFFGTFGLNLFYEITKTTWGLSAGALIAGLLGADIINLVTKRIGLTKGLQIIVAEEQLKYSGLNERQVAALIYLKTHDRLTNDVYQKINSVTSITAKRDLTELVRVGRLRKRGRGRSTYYSLVS
jgi:hypothetical protein